MHKRNKNRGLRGCWCGEGPECEVVEAAKEKEAVEAAATVEAAEAAEAGE